MTYSSSSQLMSMLEAFNRSEAKHRDWNAYTGVYTPAAMARSFARVFWGRADLCDGSGGRGGGWQWG